MEPVKIVTSKSTPKNKKVVYVPKVYGYLRVSTDKQCVETNKMSILKLAHERGLDRVVFVQETISGRTDWRKRELGKLFERMLEGDTLIMSELSRISRNFLGTLEFISECRRRKISLISVTGDIPEIDDAQSNLMLSIQSWKNQMELEYISKRTKIGLEYAKQNGKTLGRIPDSMGLEKDLENNIELIKTMIEDGVMRKNIAVRMGVCPVTLRKFIKKYKICEKVPTEDVNSDDEKK